MNLTEKNEPSEQSENRINNSEGVCPVSARVKKKIALLLFLGIVHVALTALYIVPGYLLIDEIIYHWSVRDLAATGSFEIWNGYEEHPSPELIHPFLSTYRGKLYTQYPEIFPILAVPFYKAVGFYGLFILNSLAFLITNAFCFGTAKRLFGDTDLALNSCLILALATFAWEYSQAAWPHMTSTCFVIGALYLLACAYETENRRWALAAAAGAGILAGLGPGIRFDTIYLIPSVILPLLLSKRPRIAELSALVIGIMPGLLLCSYFNYLKFEVFSPFVDGHGSQWPSYLMVCPLLAIPLAWILKMLRAIDFADSHRRLCAIGIATLLVLTLLAPGIRSLIQNSLHHAYVNTIDIRAFDQEIIRPAMSRSIGGGVVYLDAQKKALLQSMPFLALLVIPLMNFFRKEDHSGKLFLLLLLPGIYIAAFAYTFIPMSTFEGGLCLNLRYFLPAFPPLAILCAYAISNLRDEWGVSFNRPIVVVSGLATVLLYALLVERLKSDVDDLIFPLLIFPLLVAFFLACVVLVRVSKAHSLVPVDKVLTALVAVAFVWSALVAFMYDYPVHRRQRATNYAIGAAALSVVPPDSLFFTAAAVDPFMRLLERDRVRIAFPGYCKFFDFMGLLEYHQKAGRRCFAVFTYNLWEELHRGRLAGYIVTPLWKYRWGFLGEISKTGNDER